MRRLKIGTRELYTPPGASPAKKTARAADLE